MIRMGIIGAAGIAGRALVDPSRSVDEVEVVGVAARDPARAATFAEQNGLAEVYPTYEALLEDSSLDGHTMKLRAEDGSHPLLGLFASVGKKLSQGPLVFGHSLQLVVWLQNMEQGNLRPEMFRQRNGVAGHAK